jgi:hypothetical protein
VLDRIEQTTQKSPEFEKSNFLFQSSDKADFRGKKGPAI